MSKFKAVADDKLNVAHLVKLDYNRVEKIVGKGENAGDQHFLLFPRCFLKDSFSRLLNSDLYRGKFGSRDACNPERFPVVEGGMAEYLPGIGDIYGPH